MAIELEDILSGGDIERSVNILRIKAFTGAVTKPAGSTVTTINTKLDDLVAPDDNTDLNASISAHGLLKKLSNVPTEFLNGQGNFATPAGTTNPTLDVVQALSISNIATEATLYTFSVPANTIVGGMVRLTLTGDYLNDSGAARTFTVRIKYGATTLYEDATQTIGNFSTRRNWRLVLELGNAASTNSQWMSAVWNWGSGTATSGQGDLATNPTTFLTMHPALSGTSAEDSTAAKTLAVTIQHSTNHASLEIIRKIGVLERMKP